MNGHSSLADIPAGPSIATSISTSLNGMHPHVERWYCALQERPFYRSHEMIPFTELYGRVAH